jgi:hypothetical protein
MKRIAKTLPLLLPLLGLAGCTNEANTEADALLRIVRSELHFTATLGTGYVKVAVPNGSTLSASADQQWCTLTVLGDSVAVAVAANAGIEGRTALVSLSAAGETLSLPVSQAGAILALSAPEMVFEGDGGRKGIWLKNTLHEPPSVTIEGGAQWFTVAMEGDSIIFHAQASSERRRRDTVIVAQGDRRLRIGVEQLSIAGWYNIAYYTYHETTPPLVRDVVNLRKGDEPGVYFIDSLKPNNESKTGGYTNTIRCTYADRKLRLWAGQELSKITYFSPIINALDSVILFVSLLSYTQRSIVLYPNAHLVAPVVFDDSTNTITIIFEDSGDWSYYPLEGFVTGGYNQERGYVGRFDTYLLLAMRTVP